MSTKNHPFDLLQRYRQFISRRKDIGLGFLLACLIITILFAPVMHIQNAMVATLFTTSLFFILTITLSPLCDKQPLIRNLLEISGLSMLALYTLTAFTGSSPLTILATRTLTLLFFLNLMVLLFLQLFSTVSQKVKLLAALNFYLLTGISFSFLYLLVNLVNPAAFDLPDQNLGDWPEYLYFSFVTLTTLGYGDILPVSELAKSLSTLEAVIGMLSPTVMIARFVSVAE